ncbi:MAG: lysostaphin resistance A-like protein [Bradymonadaceae bacterium]
MDEQLRKWRARLAEAVAEAERSSLLEQVAEPEGRIDPHLVGIPVLGSLVLVFLEYWGGSGEWGTFVDAVGLVGPDILAEQLRGAFESGRYSRLYELAYWSGCTVLGYLLVPALYIRYAMDRPVRSMGLTASETGRHAWMYLALFALVLPVVYAVSGTQGFQSTYPFYEHAGRSAFDFVVWELLYAAQFFALEFFFRGFLIHGLKHRFGVYAVMVQIMPYCMIHFGKPAPEAVGAIAAGLVLGSFSLVTGSIWLGVAIHVSVAVSMDIFAMLA